MRTVNRRDVKLWSEVGTEVIYCDGFRHCGNMLVFESRKERRSHSSSWVCDTCFETSYVVEAAEKRVVVLDVRMEQAEPTGVIRIRCPHCRQVCEAPLRGEITVELRQPLSSDDPSR